MIEKRKRIRRKKKNKKKEKEKKADFIDFARHELGEQKFLAVFFIVMAFIFNPGIGEFSGFRWDIFFLALFFIGLFFVLSVFYKFRQWIKYLKNEEFDNY